MKSCWYSSTTCRKIIWNGNMSEIYSKHQIFVSASRNTWFFAESSDLAADPHEWQIISGHVPPIWTWQFLHGAKNTPGVSQVSGLLQRLTVAEMSIAEEQSKMEILRRYTNRRPGSDGRMDDGNWNQLFEFVFFLFQAKKIVLRLVRLFFEIFLFDKVGWITRLVWQGFIWQKIWDKVKFLL